MLLYNFFEDSTVDLSQWRVVLNSLPMKQVNCPRFDETRHSGVCREVREYQINEYRMRYTLTLLDN